MDNNYKIELSIRLITQIQKKLADPAIGYAEQKIYEAKEKSVRAQLLDLITIEELEKLLNKNENEL